MLEREGRVSIRESFEIKIAENSKTKDSGKVGKKFEFGSRQSGSYFDKRKLCSPFEHSGRTKAGVKYKKRVFL